MTTRPSAAKAPRSGGLSVAPAPAGRARVAPRAVRTSDVDRVRDLALASAVAGVVLAGGLALAASQGDLAAPGPLARPHAAAGVRCSACHAAAAPSAKTSSSARAPAPGGCLTCHDREAHASTRPAHLALARRGELACATCHPAHSGAQGVTFAAGGAFTRWGNGGEIDGTLPHGAPAGASVPLVALTACAGCHTLDDPRDPAAACVSIGGPARSPGSLSACFDEHRRVDGAPASSARSVCEAQHVPARFAAWDAARAVASATPWVAPSRGASAARAFLPALLAVFAGALALAFAPAARQARAARRAPPTASAAVPAVRVRLPQINTATCVGCYACVDACPFDVLEIHHFVAAVVRPSECCGVVLCEQVCPNGSLRISEGEPIASRPRLDDHLESLDAPGVFVAGDLSGLPLIKNAIRQGARAVERIAATLPAGQRVPASPDRVDVVIVGAGPAGISAALTAQARGLSYVTLEQGTVAASIRSFPRNKLVFDQPIDLPLEGELWLRESTKEELLGHWTRIVRVRKLRVLEHHRVESLERTPQGFRVDALTGAGARVRVEASRLVLAIGKRGTPRTLDLDIAEGAASKVSYALADARSFAGLRVLVVGLGDTAMEAACALARQPDTEVTVSYRGASFARGKARNVAELKALAAKGRVRVMWDSAPLRVTAGEVTLDVRGRRETIPNDAVLVLIGGVPSWDLVARAGVRLAVEEKAAPLVQPENFDQGPT